MPIKVSYLLMGLLLVSCAVHQRLSLKEIRELKDKKMTSYPAESEKEGKFQIENRVNFLKLLFEQSRDPYYGIPKWPQDCLEANKIGKIEQFGKNYQSVSEVYLNKSGFVGHCPQHQENIKSQLIYLYCNNQREVLEIKFPIKDTVKLSKDGLCD